MKISVCLVAAAVTLAVSAAADLRTVEAGGHKITFENQNGLAVFQGDIILGDTESVETRLRSGKQDASKHSTGVFWEPALWTDGVIPYVIDGAFSTTQRNEILEAIQHWNENTPIRLVERVSQANYVSFVADNDPYSCRSTIGMSSRAQILLPAGCGTTEIIHEIGHTVGLWHEHNRRDRNRYVTVLYENMEKSYASQFNEAVQNARDLGPYDFSSIMHYGAGAFARESGLQVLESVPAGIEFGGVYRLSAGDIDAVRRMYRKTVSRNTVSTTPSGLQLRVDGALVEDGATFDWAPGTQHTIAAFRQGDELTRYSFANWSHGGAATQTISATEGAVWVANFVTEHRVVTMASPAGSGSVSVDPPSADGFYPHRSRLRIRATPGEGYHFLHWMWSASGSANPGSFVLTYPPLITASFARQPVITLATEPPGRTLIVDDVPVRAPVNFDWAKDTLHSVGIDAAQPAFVRYRFAGWQDGAPQTRPVIPDGAAATYTAKFVRQFSLAVVSNTTSSTVLAVPASPDGFYDEGTRVELSARPARFFAFLGWSGDLSGTAATTSVVMDSQKVVLANFGAPNQVKTLGVVGAATGSDAAVAPGQLVSIYGENIGPAAPQNLQLRDDRVMTEVAGTQVLFDGTPGPITYASSGQINAVVPYAVAGKQSVTVQARSGGRTSTAISVPLKDAAPGLFTADSSGRGQAAVLNENGTFNSAANPARRGSIVVIYATGEGCVTPAVADGQVALSVYPKPSLPVSVRIGGQPATVHYAGAAPGFVAGLLQLNVQVPVYIEPGAKVPISVVIGNETSPPDVTIAVE